MRQRNIEFSVAIDIEKKEIEIRLNDVEETRLFAGVEDAKRLRDMLDRAIKIVEAQP